MTDDRIAEIRGRAAYFSGTNDVSVLFVEVDRLREQVAHLEATRIEAWSCPDCAFTFSAEHEDVGGGYSCPACQVDRVEVLIKEAQMTYVGALSGSVTVESLRAALDGKAAAMAANQELTTIECSRPRMSDEYEGAWVRLQNHETITRVLSTAPSSGA